MTSLATSPRPTTPTGSRTSLAEWSCGSTAPGAIAHPDQLDNSIRWLPAIVPGTVAAAMHASGQWDLRQPFDADASDWWYRTTFDAPNSPGESCYLCLDGLATLAEVWLNGQSILTTDNMFRAYRVDIAPHLKTHNELAIAFRSLTRDLAKRRARPRWKTNLVAQQQLRWQRTTLQGRIPGWSPPITPVGPWRAVRIETGSVLVSDVHIQTAIDGRDGIVRFQAHAEGSSVEHATVQVGPHRATAKLVEDVDGWSISAELRIPSAPLWWPHTHGAQPTLECSLIVAEHEIPCGKIAFRQLDANQENGLAIRINGEPIYCRGACWTVADIVTLAGSRETLEHDLRLARDAGLNMLRLSGTMVYESDAFYDLCDELGILVWQDFMFANMDYPVNDPAFAENIETEARQQIRRLARHPSVVVYCGNSEVEQQAAMLGMPRELWRNAWFGERLPKLCADLHPGAAYVPSTPCGGTLPFHVATGITHYYGIGAYLRSMRELRQADVKFTPECLGFANVPDAEAINELTGGTLPAIHHPEWKRRTPRDTGPGWDFEDVRDHYLKQYIGVDPVALRSFDMNRYLQLSRVVTGEMMAQVFGEWRSAHSHNQGGLVWFYKDLWPGAGWGIVDSLGIPKAAYYYLRRSWASRQITLTDEGLDGLHLHAINESAEPFRGSVEVLLLKDQHIVVARQNVPCELAPRGRQMLSADAILGAFCDVTYAYRFGPPKHDVVIATLFDADGSAISEAFHFIGQHEPAYVGEVKLEAIVTPVEGGEYSATLTADRFLQSVSVSADGFLPSDNYFHLVPGRTKIIRFRAFRSSGKRFVGYIEALNLRNPVRFATAEGTT